MKRRSSRLECLPNEILLELFSYFDAQDLFHGFYSLNYRFNSLLQSLSNLSLTLHHSTSNDIHYPYIYTLTINASININFNQFIHLHRLILLSPTSKQFHQLSLTSLPLLEHLSIGYEHYLYSSYILDLSKKIFSTNHFPCLTSCYLFERKFLQITPTLSSSNNLRILKINEIDLSIYQVLLSLSPQLNSIEFTIFNEQIECNPSQPHSQLQRMTIKFPNFQSQFSENLINCYLSFVPCLFQLNISEMNFHDHISIYLNSNWFSLSIERFLPQMKRFGYFLYLYGLNEQMNEICQRQFHSQHSRQYQSKLFLKK